MYPYDMLAAWVKKRSVCTSIVALFLVLFSGCRESKNNYKEMPARDIYAKLCLSCHGPDGNGSKIYPYALKYKEVLKDSKRFFAVVSEGVEGTQMPSWKFEISEEEIERLRLFLLSIK